MSFLGALERNAACPGLPIGMPGAGRRTLRAALAGYALRADRRLVVIDALKPLQLPPIPFGALVIAVNKMDLAGYEYETFKQHEREFRGVGLFVPVSALRGDMVAERGDRIDWYYGPTLVELLAA